MAAIVRSGRSASLWLAALPLLACSPAQLAGGRPGQDGGPGGIVIDALTDVAVAADVATTGVASPQISESSWQAMTAPRAGEHAVDESNSSLCQPVAIGQDYLVQPPTGCTPAADYDPQANPVRTCRIDPTCTSHDQCQERPHGTCRGTPTATCVYPGTSQTCASDADCRALPGGHCAQPINNDILCYPTGRCDPPRSVCRYGSQACNSDADCTLADGGHCAKLIVFAHCEYPNCLTDAECTGHTRCLCGTTNNLCVPAACRSDADCGDGHECRLQSACGTGAYLCSTDLDTCRNNQDCSAPVPMSCLFTSGRWQCGVPACPDVP
jgi:hypothetical protein